jgi:branched-chain amino acid transport system permease protein
MLLFGLGMVLMMRWRPRGLIKRRTPSVFLNERNGIAPDLVKEGSG